MTNRVLSFFEHIGHGAKIVAKETVKVAEVAAPIALPIVTHGFLPGSEVVGIEHVLLHNRTDKGDFSPMNPLEAFAFTLVLGALHSAIKNPQHAALCESQLLGLADAIYTEYGRTPLTAKVPTS